MKIIESYGGPLIGLNRCDLQHWGGIEDKLFIGDAAAFANDYEAVGLAMLNDRKLAGYLAKINGVRHEGLLINTPLPTLIVASDDRSVYLAQIESSEIGWSRSMITKDHFSLGKKDDEIIYLNVKDGGWIIFDSSASWDCMGEDFLEVDLKEGVYACESANYKEKGEVELIMIRLEKI